MEKFDEIISLLKQDSGSMICRPATDEDITKCQNDLDEVGLEPLPQGYIEFLKINNGLAWNGMEFYGTYEAQEKGNTTGYKLMDIVSMNDDFNGYYELDELVLLGRSDEEYYAYNIETKKYQVLDFTSREVYEEFDSFKELFIETAGGRLGITG